MLTYKQFCEAKEAEEKEKLDTEEESGEKQEDEESELDAFQIELKDQLAKKYPDAEEEDVEAIVISISKKIYAKFEPKDKE